jgi:hypothetical protein
VIFELFHATNDAGSARARRYVTEHALVERVRFRNVFYPEVRADLAARGGTTTPALSSRRRAGRRGVAASQGWVPDGFAGGAGRHAPWDRLDPGLITDEPWV